MSLIEIFMLSIAALIFLASAAYFIVRAVLRAAADHKYRQYRNYMEEQHGRENKEVGNSKRK